MYSLRQNQEYAISIVFKAGSYSMILPGKNLFIDAVQRQADAGTELILLLPREDWHRHLDLKIK